MRLVSDIKIQQKLILDILGGSQTSHIPVINIHDITATYILQVHAMGIRNAR